MRITITGGTGSLAQYVQDALAGEHELVLMVELDEATRPGREAARLSKQYLEGTLGLRVG